LELAKKVPETNPKVVVDLVKALKESSVGGENLTVRIWPARKYLFVHIPKGKGQFIQKGL